MDTTLPIGTRPIRASAVRWIVLGLVCSIYFVTYVDRVNISIAAPTISTELNLSPAAMGLIFSAFSIPYTLLQIPGGWLADRLGPRRALSGMGVLWALSTAFTAVPTSAVGLVLARLGVGSAEGGAFPAATRAFRPGFRRPAAASPRDCPTALPGWVVRRHHLSSSD